MNWPIAEGQVSWMKEEPLAFDAGECQIADTLIYTIASNRSGYFCAMVSVAMTLQHHESNWR